MKSNDHLQQWPQCDRNIVQFLNELTTLLRRALDPELSGIYLHGSLAMGGFCAERIDLDVLAVVERSREPAQLERLGREIALLAATCPAQRLELSLITRAAIGCGMLEVPYELHYSPYWHERILAGQVDYTLPRTDSDLPAHLYHTARRGTILFGTPISEVFGEGNRALFLRAVLVDLRWILEGALLQQPAYGVLNICRALQLLEGDPGPRSKVEGGLWGLAHLPQRFLPLVETALAAQRGETVKWDAALLAALALWARRRTEDLYTP